MGQLMSRHGKALLLLTVCLLLSAGPARALEVRCYPNPWVPGGQKADITGTPTGGITFSNIPARGQILIYTVIGTLVQQIDYESGQTVIKLGQVCYVWDGKNKDGIDAASGVYLWILKAGSVKETGKVIVVR